MTTPEARPGEGWTRIITPSGRYEYQFQGRTPAVRAGKYEDATDYIFLILDTEGILFRIPVRVSESAEAHLKRNADFAEGIRAAAAQLQAGLQKFQPRSNARYEELDQVFSMDAARAKDLQAEMESS